MPAYEYRVTSAPRRGAKAKGVRSPEARFAFALEGEMNRMAAEGWEYVRSDTLPCEERQGWLRGRAVVSRTVLVFRRALTDEADALPMAVPAYLRPDHPAPVHAAEPEARAPEDPPFFSAPMDAPVATPAAPTLPPFLTPPGPTPQAAAPPVGSPLGSPVAGPGGRDAAVGPVPTTILAAPRRAQVPPPFRPRAGEGPGPAGPPIKPLGTASGRGQL